MKNLNNKGFTLIELLAVIVILALVMGLSATSLLNSINSSRKSSLQSAAQNAANQLNTWVSEDMLVTDDNDKKLGDGFINDTQTTSSWICLGDSKLKIKNKTGNRNVLLTDALSLGKADVDLYFGTKNNNVWGTLPSLSNGSYSITDTTCSALRYNKSTGGYEFLFVAKKGGKYYVSSLGNDNFAFSRATESGESISD